MWVVGNDKNYGWGSRWGWGGRQIFKIMGNQSIDLNSFMGGMIICIHKIDKNFQKLKNFLISKH